MASVGDINTITLPDGNTYDIRDTNAVPMTGASSSAAGASGLVPAPTSSDSTKFLRGDGTWGDGGMPMVILSYGNSTWTDFINAYNNNVIVYCRASSNANPATGSQTRMAFMAYVNNATSPTEVEFQYYRSVSSHTISQQGDQVFVYKLTNASKWTVTTREAMAKIVAGTNLSSTYNNNVLTINGNYQSMTGASSSASGTSGLVPAPSAGDHEKFLKGDGTWAKAEETVYANTIEMSSSDSTKISEAIAEKVDKVTGKGLSTNDYTTADQTAVQTTLPNRITAIETAKGANGGYAELDSSGKVPASQLPSYVDDVEEYPALSDFPATGESGKIYVATSTNITYRWGGSEYVPIGSDLALGETSSTAYRGDRGKAAYDHATAKGSAYANGFYKITTNSEGHVTSASAVQKSDITDLGIPGSHQDISGKADKVSNATSGNFAGLDANGNLTDSGSKASDFLTQHQDISGKVDKNQGVAYAGKALGINNQGMVEPVEFSGTDFTGATGSTAGTHGLVPAPAATDNTKYLKGDGTWADVLPSVTSSDNGKSLEVINGEWTTGNEKIDKHFDVEKFEEKTWGKTFAPGSSYVWTDGENIYYSNSSDQYVLDKSTSTWSFKTWSGLTNFDGSYIWTDGENIYYSYNANQYVLDKSTSTWSRKTWTGLTNFDGKQIWSNGENIYYSNGATQYVLDKSTSTWSRKTWNGLTSFYGYSVWSDGENIYYSNGATQYVLDKSTSTWSRKTWKGSTSFSGNYVWTDGENIYCSNGATQYVLDKSTSTWSSKTWTGLTSFNGSYIWTDGENIYYSYNANQYVLDKSTSTWSTKTWKGSTSFSGYSVWTDGENIYYSSGANQYVLDKSTSTWSAKTWIGLTSFYGYSVWSDGENIYYSYNANQYVLDKSTSTWSSKTWTGLTNFTGNRVWSDGENIYYSNGATQYVLDKSTSTWSSKTWTGLTNFDGSYIWTDGENIYYSNSSDQYVLDKSTSTWSFKTWSGLTNFDGSYIWTDGENIYYSNGATQYVLDKSTSTWSSKTWTGLTSFNGSYIWTYGENIYYSNGSSQYKLNNIYNKLLLGRNGTFVPVLISDVVSNIFKPEKITLTISNISSNGTLYSCDFYKVGYVGILVLKFTTVGGLAAGSNITANISGIDIPSDTTFYANGYSGTNVICGHITKTNNVVTVLMRSMTSTISSGTIIGFKAVIPLID